jgi:hypothetical protein
VGRLVTPAPATPPTTGGLGGRLRSVFARERAAPAEGVGPVDALRSVGSDPDAWIVAADGDDVATIVAAAGSSALAPGSVRWLADRDDEAEGPVSP